MRHDMLLIPNSRPQAIVVGIATLQGVLGVGRNDQTLSDMIHLNPAQSLLLVPIQR
jgi:hypothetical protein